jgi:peroxiredoxin
MRAWMRRLPETLVKVLLLGALAAAVIRPAVAQSPIDFSLKDADGNEVRLRDYLGKSVIVVDFWATWCVPCVKELSHFQRFYESYKDKGLVVLAISEDGPETVAMVKPFQRRYKYTFTILLDKESKVLALYNPRVVLPYTMIIGRDGRIAKIHQGYNLGDEKMLEAEILELLEPKAAVQAARVSVSANEAFLYRHFTDRDYVDGSREGRSNQILNQLDLTLNAGNLLAGIRPDVNADFSPLRKKFSLAKRFAEYSAGEFNVRVGDFYYTVGRGLAFSLLKTFEKEGLEYIIDTTIDGGKISFGGNKFEAWGGWVDRERTSWDEPLVRDLVGGMSVANRVLGFADVGLNVVGAKLEPGSALGSHQVSMETLTLAAPKIGEFAKFYGEALLIQKDKYYTPYTIYGHGVYLESGLFWKSLTLLLEFKDYRDLDFEYNRPPLLETEQLAVVANQFVTSAKDTTGASLRADWYFPAASTLLFAKGSWIDDKPGHFPRTITHFFGGVEKKFMETGWLTLLGGYRNEQATSLVFYYTAGRTFHWQGNLSYPLTRRLSLELDIEAKDFDGTVPFGGTFVDYFERRSYLSLSYSPYVIATVLYDRTDDPEILAVKNKKDWWGGQLEIKISPSKTIRIFYGSNKGGVKCAGGVCKFFPPFEGLRIDGVLRF